MSDVATVRSHRRQRWLDGRPAQQPVWVAWHGAWLVSTVLSVFGLAGLYAYHTGRLGALGLVGLALAVPGLVLVACAAYVEAFVMPALARNEPGLLDWHGPLLNAPALRITGGLAPAWPVGIALVGGATWRANVLPRGASATLTVGALAFGAFEGPLSPCSGSSRSRCCGRPQLARARDVVLVDRWQRRIDHRGELWGLEGS